MHANRSKSNTVPATADTPESASERRRARRIRHNQQTRRDMRDLRQQLRDARALLGATRPAAV